jgi:tripartite-type tricarboxylate transporter receptor subunit TctC
MPQLVFGSWFCVMAPRNTPAPIVQTMNRLLNEILEEPESRQRLLAQGLDILAGAPDRLSTLLASELRTHAELVRFAGVRVE